MTEHRIVTALQRRDEQGNIYDLTRVFFDELLRHPFALHDDLIALGAGWNTARISRLIVIGERPRGGRKPRSRSIHVGCGSLSLGSHSAPSLERFRERVVRIKRQIGVARP
jgi:hypothetical protein